MSYLDKMTIQDVELRHKKVIVRVDFNVPLKNGVITDDTRIRAALPTIEYLLSQEAAVILMSHLGRPKGAIVRDMSLRPVAERLGQLLTAPVSFVPECVGPMANNAASRLQPGQVLLLENLRFHAEEEKNTPLFAAALASLADIYVNDAFGTAHRAHASTAGICRYLPSVSGFLINAEIKSLGRLISDPERPFAAIIGGAKISDKIKVVENLLGQVDKLLVGGGMANTFLAAAGHNMQKSLVEQEQLAWAAEFLATDIAKEKLLLPVDLVAADKFDAAAEHRQVGLDDIPQGWMALDVGPATRELFGREIAAARTIFWNGPLGVFEMDAFAEGTLSVARLVADSQAFSVIGGGDSVAAVNRAGVSDRISHISTGGGASLEFLEGQELPGVAALNDKE